MTARTTGVLSCLATAAIIFTCALFSELRNLKYIQLVLYVAINDFIASVGNLYDYGRSKLMSTLC